MDRPQLARALAVVSALAACAGPPRSGHGQAVERPGARPPSGLAFADVHARGVLVYGAAELDRVLVSVELSERFALVLRERGLPDRSIDLGPPDYDITELAVDRARGQAWVASADGSVRGYRIRDGALIGRYQLGQRATAVAVTGAYIATGSAQGVLCLRRRRDGALLQCVSAHQATLSSLDFAPDGRSLLSSSHDGTAIIWTVPTLALASRTTTPGSINRARFSPDGSQVAMAVSGSPPTRSPSVVQKERATNQHLADDSGAALAVWPRGGQARLCRGHRRPVVAIAWTSDAKHVLTGSWDRTVRLWRAADCRPLARISGFAGIVRAIDLAPGSGHAKVSAWPRDLASPALVTVEILYAPPAGKPRD